MENNYTYKCNNFGENWAGHTHEWINCEQTPTLQEICGIIAIKVVFYNDRDIKNNRINRRQKTGKKLNPVVPYLASRVADVLWPPDIERRILNFTHTKKVKHSIM